MSPKFNIEKRERVHIYSDYLCNGQWLVARQFADNTMAPKALKTLCNHVYGTFEGGVLHSEKSPDFAAIIPKRDGYVPLNRIATKAIVNEFDQVTDYCFEATKMDPETKLKSTFEVFVDPKYVPILRIGHCFAKDSNSPILILDSPDLNGNLVGLCMPQRK